MMRCIFATRIPTTTKDFQAGKCRKSLSEKRFHGHHFIFLHTACLHAHDASSSSFFFSLVPFSQTDIDSRGRKNIFQPREHAIKKILLPANFSRSIALRGGEEKKVWAYNYELFFSKDDSVFFFLLFFILANYFIHWYRAKLGSDSLVEMRQNSSRNVRGNYFKRAKHS